MLKDLALVVDSRTKEAGSYALTLMSLIDAHLTMVPVDIESALAAYASAELRYDVILAEREERREMTNAIITRLKSEGQAEGLPVAVLPLEGRQDDGMEALERSLRLYDLIVLEQTDTRRKADVRPRMIEAAVFGTSRPVLIVPYIQSRPASLKTVLVAWDGSAPAARALGDALPLLARADRVEVVQVEAKSSTRDCGAAVTRHLAQHGIDAVFKSTPSAGDVGNTLLSHAADISADLLVMGAYGHSRMREAIFGGATRTMLECMTLPVLMSR